MAVFRFSLALAACALLTSCSPVAWWENLNNKAQELATLEARHQALEQEYKQLKDRHFLLENEYAELKARLESKELSRLNLSATGSVTGRRLASIEYKVPSGLAPTELQALAYSHFRENRFAEAAKTFESLLTQPEAASLVDARALYSAGVAWFQLGNFKKSQEHLEQARAQATGEEKEKIRKKVDLWLRVIDRRLASVPHGG
jgi:tetratricopeptide (TPR) repeat protein